MYRGFLFLGNDTADPVDQNGKVLVIGGYQSTSPSYLSDVWESTNSGSSWTSITGAAAWSGRRHHAAAVLEVRGQQCMTLSRSLAHVQRRTVTLLLRVDTRALHEATCGSRPTMAHRGWK